ncbi:hypothetical protein GUJ93_ZPchr0014g47053 [Zizania palustris]|uniref:Transcription repressor n=1 Tax=Zizania palustris TaxID=103762 RepID=A0A8J5T8U6_ZIZPA|nr:hypothetical protein GUJ93_ZPchr0014g47053 [Zizania palustris]
MPPLNPPRLHFHKLKKQARAAAGGGGGGGGVHPSGMAKKGLVGILYKLRDVHRAPKSSPSPHCYHPPSAWPWPSCRHPRTSSFRGREEDAAVYRTANAVYDMSSEHFNQRRSSMDEASTCIDRNFLAVPGEAAAGEPEEEGDQDMELQLRETAVVSGVRSERLFFEPAGAEFLPNQEMARCENEATATDVALKNEEATTTPPTDKEEAVATVFEAAGLKGGAVLLTVESDDPYGDFRASMAEMVAAHGLRDWEGLEELLSWYLKLNAKGVHGVIVGAFIDLLVSLASSPSRSQTSPSPSSSCITFEGYSSATMEEESCS